MGQGLQSRLKAMGIEGLTTSETNPDSAVAAYLAGTLPLGTTEAHGDPGHMHHHHDSVVFVSSTSIQTPLTVIKKPT